ncbi:sigma-70 family RNA polymerase sigma factor [Actinomadura fulvescens]|uniref:Sigma-70 family RNA polymerase sigma factor n=1 Tax=Actinomadura fulvescens TaxID=46160 RepID=A0ABP6CCY7_9ACTN
MNDHLLVEVLRSRDSGGPAALYEAYADRLYAYCWFQLRNRDAAQVALRDTFIVAEAHVDKLRDPDRFGPWLYAVARMECGRRMPYGGQQPDLLVASHDQEDVDQRIMAWQAVLGLAPLSREILELRVRHQLSVPDLAAVFDLPVKEAQAALDRAHAELEVALTAEILAHQGPYGCPDRGVILRDRRGEMDLDLRLRLLRHAEECALCEAFRPRTVSAAKVYGLLPQADPPDALRLRVMSCFLDPELVGYRLFVATRITEFTPGGFPAQPRRFALPRRPGLPRRSILARRPRRSPFPLWPIARRRPAPRRSQPPSNATTPPDAAQPGGTPVDATPPGAATDGTLVRSTSAGDTSAGAAPTDDAPLGSASAGAAPSGGTLAGAARTSAASGGGTPVGSVPAGVSAAAGIASASGVRRGGFVRVGRLRAAVRGVAAAAMVVLLLGTGAVAFVWLVSDRPSGTVASGRLPSPGVAPILPPTDLRDYPPSDSGLGGLVGSPVSATFPLGARGSAAPPTALPSPPRKEYHSAPDGAPHPRPPGGSGTLSASPLHIDLAGGSDATITLRAEGGPVSWRAKTWGPLRLSTSSGHLQNGQSTTVSVHVFRRPGGRGQGGITFLPGGLQVHISWRPAPTDPGTTPPPTTTPPPSKPSSPPASTPPPSSPSTPPSSSTPPPSTPPPSSSTPPAPSPSASGSSPETQASG